ncbi:MAG: L-threonylcarbamoyladenylate synthase [Bacillota bacterium]
MTELIRLLREVEPTHPAVQRAAAILREGGLVAFPTETVYGLGANGLDEEAVRKIFAVKGRPADNPLILHLGGPEEARSVVAAWPETAARLADAFWPGPLTMVLPRLSSVPPVVSAGLPTVAVRVPAHPVALALIRAAGLPIAAPSANASGRPSPTEAAHVLADLGGKVEMILDAGPTEIGVESTVVDLTAPVPRLLRPGGVSVAALEAVLGPVGLDLKAADLERPLAPGMKYRHYAPRAPLFIVVGAREAVVRFMAREAEKAAAAGRRLALLVHGDAAASLAPAGGLIFDLGPRGRTEVAAQRLFSLLRACDEAGAEAILAEAEEEEGLGLAVMNRLLKAAGGRVIRAEESTECADLFS